MTSKISIDNRELLQKISIGEAAAGIDFGNAIVRELAAFRLAAMDSEPVAYMTYKGYLLHAGDPKLAEYSEPMPLYADPRPASTPAAPVAWDYEWASCITCEGPQNFNRVIEREAPPEWAVDEGQARNIIPLYRHAQQPVVPDEKPMPNSLSMYAVDAVAAIAEVKGWKACRAAMLAADPQLPGSEPATVPGKWIPVSERLPEDSGRYWCYVEEQNDLGKSHYQWNCSWNGDRWWVESECGGIVTHWMPLPAAPREVKGE